MQWTGIKHRIFLHFNQQYGAQGRLFRFVFSLSLMVQCVFQIVDAGVNRTVFLTKSGLPDAVVWNPWIAKAKATGDFGDEEYKEMLCVEPAVAASGPITVKAGQSWCGSQVLVVE